MVSDPTRLFRQRWRQSADADVRLPGPCCLMERGRSGCSTWVVRLYYTGGRLLVEDPAGLYDQAAGAAVEQALQGGAGVYMPYLAPPQAAALMAPLARLGYGQAYLVWGLAGLTSLAISAWLLAPRPWGRWSWLAWLPAAALL